MTDWDIVVRALKQSENLLKAVLAKDAEAVARGIEEAHMETSHIQYNDENALSYTISLAFFSARQKYRIFRELPTGKGLESHRRFSAVNGSHVKASQEGKRSEDRLADADDYADLVFLPRPLHANLPALVIELKWDRDVMTAIRQIKNRCYGKALEDYAGRILAVGISYDKDTRRHECIVEEYEK